MQDSSAFGKNQLEYKRNKHLVGNMNFSLQMSTPNNKTCSRNMYHFSGNQDLPPTKIPAAARGWSPNGGDVWVQRLEKGIPVRCICEIHICEIHIFDHSVVKDNLFCDVLPVRMILPTVCMYCMCWDCFNQSYVLDCLSAYCHTNTLFLINSSFALFKSENHVSANGIRQVHRAHIYTYSL